MKYTLVTLFIIFTSCNGQKKVSVENKVVKADSNQEARLTLLLQDNYSGSDSVETLVIKDYKTLAKFFSKINRTRKPGLPVPEVNFSEKMVIIYCGGIRIENVLPSLSIIEETDDKMVFEPVVPVSDTKRKIGAATSPFCVYSIPFTDKEIVFNLSK